MSTLADLEMMQALVDAKYLQQKESFALLMAQESRLRNALHQLDIHMSESRCNSDAPQKAIGADVIWQAWIGRKKRELNMQLAQVLAIKERHISQVRKAYGKVLVTQTLTTETRRNAQSKNAQSRLNHTLASMMF